MTYREKYDSCKNWLEKIDVMNLFHKVKSVKNNKWRYRDTARYFGCALGLVSENLRLAEEREKIKHFDNRKRALLYLKGSLK